MSEVVTSQPSQLVFLRGNEATKSFDDGHKTFELRNGIRAFKGHRIMVELIDFEVPIS